jgi:hypothetical protein
MMTRTKGISPIPPGITTHRRAIKGGMVYEFDHERLGLIGRLSLLVHGSHQTQIAVDTPPGDPDDPLWEERFTMLDAVARACLCALGDSNPLPGIEEAKANARLYRRFTHVQHSLQMWDFARGLSEEDYARLLAAATQSLQVASSADALGIQQRIVELQAFRTARPEERPNPADGVHLGDGTRVVVRRRSGEKSARPRRKDTSRRR